MIIKKAITIFLVDDNALYLKDLELAFSSKSYYKVITFATGEHCLENMKLKPDIIVLDYYLNSVEKNALNGLEILKKIREITSDVPVVILSTETNEEIAKSCLDHNANEFIIKSDICFARLREIISAVLIDKQDENNENLISRFTKAFTGASLLYLSFTLNNLSLIDGHFSAK